METPCCGPEVGLHVHDLVQVRVARTLGVVREDEVDRLALLAQPVGEQDLPDLHVDAHEQTADLGVGIADADARVGVRVGELLGVEERLVVGVELVVLLAVSRPARGRSRRGPAGRPRCRRSCRRRRCLRVSRRAPP